MYGDDIVRRSSALALALLVVVTSTGLAAVLVPSASPVQPVSADIGQDGCADDITIGLLTGAGATIYSNARDPCWSNDDPVVDSDSAAEARLKVAKELLEDERHERIYFQQFAEYSAQLDSPAYLDGKATFVSEMRNGSGEVESITDARDAVRDRVSAQQRALLMEYRSMLQSAGDTAWEAEDAGVSDVIIIGQVDTASNSLEVSNWSITNVSTMDAARVDVTLANGSTMEIPAPYRLDEDGSVVDVMHPLDDNMLVAVDHPESGFEPIINQVSVVSGGGVLPTDGGTGSWSEVEDLSSLDINITIDGRVKDSGSAATPQIGLGAGGGVVKILATETGAEVYKSSSNKIATIDAQDGEWTVSLDMSDGQNIVVFDGGTEVANVSRPSVDSSDSTLLLKQSASNNAFDEYTYDTGAEYPVDDYENQYQSSFDQLESIKSTVISALGDSESGYLSDAADAVDLGAITWSDVYTPGERYRMSVEPSDIGEASWLAFQYNYLGFSGSNVSEVNVMDMTLGNGSVVNGNEIASDQSVSGLVWTTGTPPNGSWVAGERYSVNSTAGGADLNATVYITATVASEEFVNGSVTYGTQGKTFAVESGQITVDALRDSDGTSISSVTHIDRDPESTDVTQLTQLINEMQQTIRELDDRIDEDNDGNQEEIDINPFPEWEWPSIPSVDIPSAGDIPWYLWAGGVLVIVLMFKGGGGAARVYLPNR